MNFKRFTTAICLAAGLVLAAPSFVPSGTVSGIISTVSAAEGWNQDGNGYYYVEGGAKVTGQKVIDGAGYCFGSNGYRLTGPVTIGETTYYYEPSSGKLAAELSGLFKSSDETGVYYFFRDAKNGSVATSTWVSSGGKSFYADASGRVKLGTVAVNGVLYHITSQGRMTSYGKSSFDNKYYYATSTGKLKTGLQTISGKRYFFNQQTGARQTGTVKVGQYYYYFNNKNGASKTGWVTSTDINGDKITCYYDKKGRRLSGLQKISGKYYYLNPKHDDARIEDATAKVNGKTYYFDEKGVRQTGFYTIKDKTYYAKSNGNRQKGWLTLMGRKYFFNKKTRVMQTGWYKTGSKTYYFNPVKSSSTYGAAITGFRKIDGSTYYFNPDCTMRTGWLLDNMKYYYFDTATGKMYTGKHKIDGETYDFGANGASKTTITGGFSVKVNRKQCFVVIYKGNTPIKAFICSTAADGVSTPTGTFSLRDKLRWHELMGPSWGQYCSHLTSDILFHSVPCNSYRDNHSMSPSAFNMLGRPASHGCIRLAVVHAKWIYDNLPIGTPVYISDSVPKPTTVVIETTPKIPSSQHWDPTDPNA